LIYFLIYLLFYPYLFAMKKLKFKGEKGKILLIQTAKIGDYANSTVIFEKLGKFDVLIDEINLAFAKHDRRIEKIFTINGVKRKKASKLGLALELFSRNYESVYVLMPNSLNLFLARCTLAKNIVAVHHYAASSDFALLALGMKKAPHTLRDLTLLTYLKTLGESELKYEKCLQKPLVIPRENLVKSVHMAEKAGVILAFETMENPFMDTAEKAMHYVRKIGSCYLNVYPDIGNLNNAALLYGHDVFEDLKKCAGHISALHLKETESASKRLHIRKNGSNPYDNISYKRFASSGSFSAVWLIYGTWAWKIKSKVFLIIGYLEYRFVEHRETSKNRSSLRFIFSYLKACR